MTIGVIVATYQRASDLRRCLEALAIIELHLNGVHADAGTGHFRAEAQRHTLVRLDMQHQIVRCEPLHRRVRG